MAPRWSCSFFTVLALSLPRVGLLSFALAAGAALLTQTATIFAVPAGVQSPQAGPGEGQTPQP